jgi:hypothetical protein
VYFYHIIIFLHENILFLFIFFVPGVVDNPAPPSLFLHETFNFCFVFVPGVVDNPTPMPVRRPNVRNRNSMQVANPLSPMPKAQRIDPAKVTFRQLYLKRKL